MTDADSAQPSKEQNRNNSEDQPPAKTAVVTAKVARIRDLNDKLRTTQRGGIVLITDGVAVLGQEAGAILDAVARFADFNPDNDPWGEHDCACLEVSDHRVIWKIDYYDRSRRIHSPDPADPKVTVRVLTVMLASEY